MAEKGFTIVLSARTDAYVRALDQAKKATGDLSTAAGSWSALGNHLEGLGKSISTKVTLPLAALGAGAVASAVQWESAWAGVTKTVDGTAAQMASLEGGLRDMAKELPATHSEIAAVAEAAGQLGVGVQDVEAFTRTMIDLGETTNLSANEAATQLARFMNIMGSSTDAVGNIGAAVVGLGNNFATTEAEIVSMGMRLAGAGAQMGLTEGEVLGLATALSSVGIEAEAGGTAMTLTMKRIATEVETSGALLGMFAEVAGMTADQFASAWRDDAGAALVEFIGGLADTESMGMSTIAVLEELGITGVRESDALLRLSGATEQLTSAMQMGNAEYEKGTALTEEAQKRYNTFASQLAMLRNQLVDVGISLGDAVLPALSVMVDMAGGLVAAFDSLPGPVKGALVAFAGLVAVIGPALWITGSLIGSYQTLTTTLAAYRAAQAATVASTTATTAATGGLTAAMAALRAAMVAHPILTIAAVISGVATAFGVFGNSTDAAKQKVDELADGIRDAETLFKGLADAVGGAVKENDQLRQAMLAAGSNTGEMTRAIDEGGAALEAYVEKLRAGAEAAGLNTHEVMGVIVALGQLAEASVVAAQEQDELNQVTESGIDRESLRRQQMDYVSGLRRRAEAAREAGDAETDRAKTWELASQRIEYVTNREVDTIEAAFEAQMQYLDDHKQAAADWYQAINGSFAGGKSAITSFADESLESVQAFVAELNTDTAAVHEWMTNLTTIAAQTSPEFAAFLADMGLAGAGVVEEIAKGGDDMESAFTAWSYAAEVMNTDMAAEFAKVSPAAAQAIRDLEAGTSPAWDEIKGFFNSEGVYVGEQGAAGIAAGLTSSSSLALVSGAARTVTDHAAAAARENMRIHSPSQVMAELVGLPMVQGIAQGIIDGSPEAAIQAAEAAKLISKEVAKQMRDDLQAQEEARRMAERVAGAVVSEFDRQRDLVMDAAIALRRAAEDALGGAFDAIGRRFTEEDLRDRISDAADRLAEKQRELADAQRLVASGPKAEAAARAEVRAAEARRRAAEEKLRAAEEAARTDSPELAAARRRLQEAEAALARAKVEGSDLGWFQDQVSAAKVALGDLERTEKQREEAAVAAARAGLRAAESGVTDAQRDLDDLLKKLDSARGDVGSLPKEIEDAEKALKRANLRLFEMLAREGVSPMGHGAAQRRLREIGEAAGLTHEEMLAIAKAQVDLRNAERSVEAAGRFFPEKLTLVIEGKPFEAMLAEHDRQLLEQLRAGVSV